MHPLWHTKNIFNPVVRLLESGTDFIVTTAIIRDSVSFYAIIAMQPVAIADWETFNCTCLEYILPKGKSTSLLHILSCVVLSHMPCLIYAVDPLTYGYGYVMFCVDVISYVDFVARSRCLRQG